MKSAVDGEAALSKNDAPAPYPGLGLIDRACEILCGLALVTMIVMIGAEAIARNVFGFSLQITDEVGGYLLVAISFLSLPIAQSSGAFHHVELVQAKLPVQTRLLSAVIFDFLSLGGCGIIAWQLVDQEIAFWQTGDTAGTPLGTPLWLPQLVMPVGMVLFCIAIVRSIIRKLSLLRRPVLHDGIPS
jgi:TRAP-type C4-dicarboxylate transport system permease small subunit